jgi:hypothetical protein
MNNGEKKIIFAEFVSRLGRTILERVRKTLVSRLVSKQLRKAPGTVSHWTTARFARAERRGRTPARGTVVHH